MKARAFVATVLLFAMLVLTACTGVGDPLSQSEASFGQEEGNSENHVTENDTPPLEFQAPSVVLPPIPEDALNVVEEWGILPGLGNGMSNSIILLSKFSELQEGVTVYFPQGEYELRFPIYLANKKNVRIAGDHATLIRTGVSNTSPIDPRLEDEAIPSQYSYLTESSALIIAQGNSNLCIDGFSMMYKVPTSLSGTIVNISGGTVDVEITSDTPVSGEEYVTAVSTFLENGVPSNLFEQYAESSFPIEKLSDNTVRIYGLDAGGISKLRNGINMCLMLCRHKAGLLRFTGSKDVTLSNITLKNSFASGIHISGRCENFILSNLKMRSDDPNALMSLSADGIHISGLGGELTVENCLFERLGDDAININNTAYTINSMEGKALTLSSPRFGYNGGWACVGDTLAFYDRESFEALGEAVIGNIEDKLFTFEALPENIEEGTVVVNRSSLPSAVIRNNEIKMSRARGFLIQSENVLIENNSFYGICRAAILMAPDLKTWYEMTPAKNITIRGNRFEECSRNSNGVIQIVTSHSDSSRLYDTYIHENIVITENSFVKISRVALLGVCVNGIQFTANKMSLGKYNGDLVKLEHCKDVVIEGTDKVYLVDVR